MKLDWYARRLASMSPGEVAGRLHDRVLQAGLRLAHRQVRPLSGELSRPAPRFPAPVCETDADIDPHAHRAVIDSADGILAGRWPVFGSDHLGMTPAPDWFLDPRSGIRAPADAWCWSIHSMQPNRSGDLRYLWELSRHQHVTLLGAAYALSGDERYALAAERQLRSWWSENPFLRGPHWSSCMELGLRLIAWVWTRRLLSGWKGVCNLFDANSLFRTCLYQHQYLLSRFPARGSSANNHLIAEAAGQFVACCALPYFEQTPAWCEAAARTLRAEIRRQTFASGLHRELASDYHVLVLELAIAAGVEGEATEHSLGADFWQATCAMMDALAASVDSGPRPPRQGDGDSASALRIDAPDSNQCASLLNTGRHLMGALHWWPKLPGGDVRTSLWSAMVSELPARLERPAARRDHFPDAGMTILRDTPGRDREIWCRCDAGPHGFLSIAAHAHADALSIELRCGGIDVLADPGTYTYHAEPAWRRYFRSTLAHNTLEVAGCDQSVSGGPFLWTQHAQSTEIEFGESESDGVARWAARHDGYERLPQCVTHRRNVELERQRRTLQIEDRVTCRAPLPVRLAFHLGPQIECELDGSLAALHWDDASGRCRAVLRLPDDLAWQAVRGRSEPPLGWYSPAFGVRVPAWCLLGEGRIGNGTTLRSEFWLEESQEFARC
jgi:hypothetical protein